MILKTKIINVDGLDFIVQSYLKGDFCHIVESKSRLGFRFCLERVEIIGTWGKEDYEWIIMRDKINPLIVKEIIELENWM